MTARGTSEPDTFVLTVDVECDSDGGATWRNSSPLAFEGVNHGVAGVLLPILEDAGALATLLVSNVVLDHAPSCEILARLPRVELGTHLHGDYLPPHPRVRDPAGEKSSDNQCDYPPELEHAKLVELTTRFEAVFGDRPGAFRAGRWSAGARTARLLGELGYRADSSVSPHVHWTDAGRSVDHRRAPEQPYRPAADDIARPGDLPIWELPVSIVAPWWAGRRPIWLRPSLSSTTVMRHVVGDLARRHASPRTYVAMLHNTELTPGASPYSRNAKGALAVAERLRRLLTWAAGKGMRFATMSDAASACQRTTSL